MCKILLKSVIKENIKFSNLIYLILVLGQSLCRNFAKLAVMVERK